MTIQPWPGDRQSCCFHPLENGRFFTGVSTKSLKTAIAAPAGRPNNDAEHPCLLQKACKNQYPKKIDKKFLQSLVFSTSCAIRTEKPDTPRSGSKGIIKVIPVKKNATFGKTDGQWKPRPGTGTALKLFFS
ncbi:MAG: hypothetical protein JRI36_11245 [Deltaproteobacteria bacterium]|nr:hypothetical protein [Deltaproteobacteria bacterium]